MNQRWKYINLKPTTPTIKGLIKIHREESPIQPIINWRNAPAYKLAKQLVRKLQSHIPLPNALNILNTTQLIEDVADIPYNNRLKLASFDITNMYTNIPTNELLNITDKLCQNNLIDVSIKENLIMLTETVIDQNYFQFLDTTYIQSEGLAMGAPTSSVLSEIYLQHLENSIIINLLITYSVTGYFRYADDILIVYNENVTNIDALLHQFNNITPKLKFTIKKETDRKLHFLDITITRGIEEFIIDIHRKPMYTDIIIPEDSCHPKEHKMTAIRYLYIRMNKYHLAPKGLEKENHVIQQILYNNGYDVTNATKVLNKKKANMEKDNNKKTHWAKFTYIGKETRLTTKAFKNTNVSISFSTKNTISNLLTARRHSTKGKYDNSRIYQLTCPTCKKKYIGQID
jgi:hypothetical protein